jgi:quercetin dioxygenase-like cupin family protein
MADLDTAAQDHVDEAARGSRPGRQGMTLFSAANAVELFESETMSFPAFAPGDLEAVSAEELDLSPAAVGNDDQVLFRGEGDEGFSLVRAWFAPHYVLPRHSHDADCLYYLAEGSIVMGARTIEAGNGFFIPADAPYAFEAGPDGAVVLEFRQRTSFDMKVTPGQIARYRKMAEVGAAHAEEWAELRQQQHPG